MELKTDKIHRILNTPYDELRPQDFDAAQGQLDILIVEARDKQIDAFQFIENKLVCERDEALKRVSELTDQLAAQQEKPVALELMARIADLKRVAQTDAEAIANLTKERDQLDDELTELRQAPSGTAKQAERIRELEDALREERAALKSQCERSAATMADGVRLIFERDAIKAELEQAKAQAANASAMVVAITAERDAVQARETKLLWLIAGATERAERAEQQAKDERERRERYREIDDRAVAILREQHAKDLAAARGARVVKSTDDLWPASMAAEFAAAEEAQNKREAELDAYGYGRAPGTPPAEVTGLYDHQCQMPTPDGKCTARATGRNHGQPFCSRHLDAIRDGMRREHERTAIACPGCGGIGKQNIEHDCAATRDAIRGAVSGPKPASTLERERFMASSIDGGKSWWCPACQASIVPDVPHVCPGMTCRRCGSSVLDGRDHGVGACPGGGHP